MTDLLTWSINLGRWAGVQVRVHYFLILFALGRLFNAAFSGNHNFVSTLGWLLLLMVVLALHELGHAAMAMLQNADGEDVTAWPLGNLVIPGPSRSNDNVSVAAAGLATSGMLAIGTALVLNLAGAQMIFNPFGFGIDPGSPILRGEGVKQVEAFRTLWWIGWFGHLNWVLFLANLIPALPFDLGRILRALLAQSSIGLTRDNPYAQWTARGFAVILALVGLVQAFQSFYVGLTLFSLACLIELVVRTESRIMEDGGFFDDGVFGYDFSEGYTSLEGSTAKVRPTRESTIKRWRRRRSELRKVRRLAREAAEERRMDEILEKVHIQGKASLSDEEHRFLVRVSTKIRNRTRARD